MMIKIGHIGSGYIGKTCQVYVLPVDKIDEAILLTTDAFITLGDTGTESASVVEKFAHEVEFLLKRRPIIPDMVQNDYAYSPSFRRKKKNTEKKSFWKQRIKNLQNKR